MPDRKTPKPVNRRGADRAARRFSGRTLVEFAEEVARDADAPDEAFRLALRDLVLEMDPNVRAATRERQQVERALYPRLENVLARLLAGDSEKQAALALGLSKHTVHVYVKHLYQRFGVESRGELLALFSPRDRRRTGSLPA